MGGGAGCREQMDIDIEEKYSELGHETRVMKLLLGAFPQWKPS